MVQTKHSTYTLTHTLINILNTKIHTPYTHRLTMSGKAGGGNKTLAQGLLSLVRYGPVVSKDSTLQLVQVGGGKLHIASRAVSILIIASL